MKITAWRITREKYSREAFSGEGAKRFGGRWNPAGYLAVYLAQHLSLAILELIVHLDEHSDIRRFVAIPVSFDHALVQVLPQPQLPDNWSDLPISPTTQMIGEKWIKKNKRLVLQVPSSVASIENNYLVNPLHPDFPQLEIGSPEPLNIDQRIARILH